MQDELATGQNSNSNNAVVATTSSRSKKKKPKNKQVKDNKTPKIDDVEDSVIDNLILRIKLPQAVKVLLPVAIFVVTNHACKWSLELS